MPALAEQGVAAVLFLDRGDYRQLEALMTEGVRRGHDERRIERLLAARAAFREEVMDAIHRSGSLLKDRDWEPYCRVTRP